MRILFVCERAPYLPCPEGDRAASAELLAALAASHDVAVLGVADRGDSEIDRRWSRHHAVAAEILPAAPWRHPLTGAPGLAVRALGDALERRAKHFSPDVAYLDGALTAPLAERAGVPVVLAPHAVSRATPTSPLTQLGAWLGAYADERWERRWFPAAAACIVPSYDDRAALARWLPAERLDVIPAGIDLARYTFRRSALEGDRIVFAGDVALPAHAEAARRFVASVLPAIRRARPHAELLLVGTAPSAAVRRFAGVPGVRVMAPVADVRPSLWGAAACAGPLAGGSTRSLLVPAMALGTPVVASAQSLGAIADAAVDGRHLLVASTEAAMTDAILTVLGQRIVGNTLARNARGLVERRYTWRSIAAHHEAVLARVTGAGAPQLLRQAA